jgi:hypothetical protein
MRSARMKRSTGHGVSRQELNRQSGNCRMNSNSSPSSTNASMHSGRRPKPPSVPLLARSAPVFRPASARRSPPAPTCTLPSTQSGPRSLRSGSSPTRVALPRGPCGRRDRVGQLLGGAVRCARCLPVSVAGGRAAGRRFRRPAAHAAITQDLLSCPSLPPPRPRTRPLPDPPCRRPRRH